MAPQHVVQVAERGDTDHDGQHGEDRAEEEIEQEKKGGSQHRQPSERQGSLAVPLGVGILHVLSRWAKGGLGQRSSPVASWPACYTSSSVRRSTSHFKHCTVKPRKFP